jgi:aspartate beta-hydroxylase
MKAYGVEQPRNMAACPRLAAIVRADPQVLSASFSFLAPHKHIPIHRGPLRGVLRFFLMLSMPTNAECRPAAVLKVAGTEYRLNEGDCLLWDDTYPHEAWNDGDAVRIVLSLDIHRAGMPLDMRLLSGTLVRIVRLGMTLRRFNASGKQSREIRLRATLEYQRPQNVDGLSVLPKAMRWPISS